MDRVRPGDTLAGKYVVTRVLGEGGMGVVVAATHMQLGKRVAIKYLRQAILEKGGSVARFIREAKSSAQIPSPHCVQVTDVGALPSGAPFMVMERLQGEDLGSMLERSGPLSEPLAANFVRQATEALVVAHERGIIHRDLKPANLFCCPRAEGPFIKVLDFGIAKAMWDADADLTTTAAFIGSPAYMSPEQARDPKRVDERTDVWSLGICLYELVTRKTPYRGKTPQSLLAKVVLEPVEPMRTHRKEVSTDMANLVMDCLQKDRESRLPSVAVLRERLLAFGQTAGVLVTGGQRAALHTFFR